ncbi:hypothetical protein V3330_01775 [Wenzhouxiangellaceae bacterium CH-27]|uniref:Uncharacterized protein n=2 Tax=Elongatibacter sediminis TaxID=3119006 RepID=A0AAW9RC30_9GAMM
MAASALPDHDVLSTTPGRPYDEPMNAYLWKSNSVIAPFGDAVSDVLIANETLRERQRRTLEKLGLTVHETEDPDAITDREFLLVRDDLYFNQTAAKRFLDRAREADESVVCALEQGPFTEFTAFLQNLDGDTDPDSGDPLVLYGMYFCRAPAGSRTLPGSYRPLKIPARQRAHEIAPGDFVPTSVGISFTPAISDAMVMHVRHWTHLWLINLLVMGTTLLRRFTANRLALVWRVLSALSFNRQKIARRFVIKGKGCRIHPTATVEGCVLGDRVSIGAYSIVRGCILGDGVRINEQSIVTGSVFGEAATCSPRGWAKACVIYPAAVAGKIQACMVGHKAFLASPAHFIDLKFQGTIKVTHQGEIVDTGMNFLGACIGHEAVVGADVWVAAGREIPNGALLVKPPGDILSKIPADLPPGRAAAVRNSEACLVDEAGRNPPDSADN